MSNNDFAAHGLCYNRQMTRSEASAPATAIFLRAHGWPPERTAPFPADWSARRYARVMRDAPPHRAVLMQAVPDADFKAFIRIARLLRDDLMLAAPEIYAADTAQGFLLLEDFGDANFGRLLDGNAEPWPLYKRALSALIRVQKSSLSLVAMDLPQYDSTRFITQLEPVLTNFSYADPAAAQADWQVTWQRALAPLAALPQALLLRDFMPDNLMSIPPRTDGQDVGLLDFELAGIGPLAYDLASLLEEVRRDLPAKLREQTIAAYLQEWPELDATTFRGAVELLGVQRHARIFARLKTMSKPDFYIRCLSALRELLQTPGAAPVRPWFTTYLPQYFT